MAALALAPATARADEHDHDAPPQAAMADMAPEFSLHGFSDITLGFDHDQPRVGPATNRSAFSLGQFDLYMVSRLEDRISFLGEAVIESDAAGETHVDLERAFIKYSWADAFRISAGRTHTALGYWNEAFHHGALLQPTVERPIELRFEDDGGLLPVHSVGLELSGRMAAGGLTAAYVANVANGRGEIVDAVQVSGDLNRHKATALKLSLTRPGDVAVTAGITGYLDHIPGIAGDPLRGAEIRERIGGVHAHVVAARGELLAEGFVIRHDDTGTDASQRHRMAYAVGSLHFGAWSPYAMVETIHMDAGDAFFGPAYTSHDAVAAGVRFEPSPFAAIKLELDEDRHDGGRTRGVRAQTAFSF